MSREPAITILVVDDDPSLLRVIRTMLEKLGHHVLTASDGNDALCLAAAPATARIDILLTDYRMPAMRGDELAQRFHRSFPEAAIIVMSAECPELSPEVRFDFLAKPFQFAALSEKVSAARVR
jgi:CheY-like chemotaxis protein